MAQQVNSKHAQVVATPLWAKKRLHALTDWKRNARRPQSCCNTSPHTQHKCLWEIWVRGASRYDVSIIFGFFTPSSPCQRLELINTIKFTQPLLLCPLFQDTPPPFDADFISESSLRGEQHPSSGLTEKGREEGDFVSRKRDLGALVGFRSVEILSTSSSRIRFRYTGYVLLLGVIQLNW